MRALVLAVGLVALSLPGFACAVEFSSPKDLLVHIYAGQPSADWTDERSYFSDTMLVLLDADKAREAGGEVRRVQGDAFGRSPGPDGERPFVGEPLIDGIRASAEVTLGEPASIILHFELVMQANGWKIDDIYLGDYGGGGWRLSELLTDDPLLN